MVKGEVVVVGDPERQVREPERAGAGERDDDEQPARDSGTRRPAQRRDQPVAAVRSGTTHATQLTAEEDIPDLEVGDETCEPDPEVGDHEAGVRRPGTARATTRLIKRPQPARIKPIISHVTDDRECRRHDVDER